ncbi:MAG: hypothetical protein ABW061_06895 [Polyangiaceae bacterium]
MPRLRASLKPPRREIVRCRSWAHGLLAGLLVLAAILLFGARGDAAALQVVQHSGPTIDSRSQSSLADAAPRRIDAQVKRDRVWLDLPLLPLAARPSAVSLQPEARSDAPALGPGCARAHERDLRLTHFRRRIPRMNSEDPPCG